MDLMKILQSPNPRGLLESMAQNSPTVARALQMTNGKSEQDVMQIANNLAKEQGVDLNALRQNLGI